MIHTGEQQEGFFFVILKPAVNVVNYVAVFIFAPLTVA